MQRVAAEIRTADRKLRTVRFAPYLQGKGPTFTLNTWDTYRTDSQGRTVIAYEFTQHVNGKSELLFSGADFSAGPHVAIDSDESIEGLMGFLTLRPGDTDPDYFKDYTPAQHAFADAHAEAVSMVVSDRYLDENGRHKRRKT